MCSAARVATTRRGGSSRCRGPRSSATSTTSCAGCSSFIRTTGCPRRMRCITHLSSRRPAAAASA
eukprot:1227050-Prymnesium_polylepis.1